MSKFAIIGLFFFILTLLVYSYAITGGFIWDDFGFIVNNQIFKSPGALSKIWLSKELPDYWPVSYTVFWIEGMFFGLNPTGYHVVNFAIHALTCASLWQVLSKLKFKMPLLIATLFCLHPLNVESVAWISQTKTTLAGALVLLSTVFYLKRDKKSYYFISVFLFLLANLAKTSVVTWPLVILGYEFVAHSFQIKKVPLARLIPYFLISFCLGVLHIFWHSGKPFTPPDLLERVAASGPVFLFYIYKILIPINLSLVYPRWSMDIANVLTWIPLFVVLAGFVVSIKAIKKWPIANLTLLYLLLTIFPVLGIIPFYYQTFSWAADHYAYLPLAGVLAGAVSLVRNSTQNKKLAGILSVIALTYFALTITRSQAFQSDEKIWKDVIAKNPDVWVAHNNLANTYRDQGHAQEAINEFKEALKIKPDYYEAQIGIATLLQNQGDINGAIEHYLKALEINPTDAPTRVNLGVLHVSGGNIDAAITDFKETLKIKPDLAEAHNNLGVMLAQQGQLDEALAHYSEALRIKPDYAEAHDNIGIILVKRGQTKEAAEHFTEALRLKPNFEQAKTHLDKIKKK
jgi:tetratricopeptide (TPR) repeat protein